MVNNVRIPLVKFHKIPVVNMAGLLTSQPQKIIAFMLTAFPALQWRTWELSWLNEFVNHLIAKNTFFVEVESDGCSFVFSALNQKYPGQVLLRPTSE